MAHPLKKSSDDAMNAKMRRMTQDYGDADPSANKPAPVNRMKAVGLKPEESVGFGADSENVSPRSDRPARRAIAANPLATYASGGGVAARARGGRTKGKGKGTHVNVIVAPQAAPAAAAPPVMPPIGAGGPPPMPPAMPPKPLMGPPPGGPMGPGPMAGPPGAMPPGLMPPRAKGGRVDKHHMTAGAVTGVGRLEKIGEKPKMGKPQTV